MTDTRAEKQPPSSPPVTDSLSESGQGLLLVAALSDDWGVTPRHAAPGKTVWAELRVQQQGHPRTHRVAPESTDIDFNSTGHLGPACTTRRQGRLPLVVWLRPCRDTG